MVRVRFYARLREAAGRECLELKFSGTVDELLRKLCDMLGKEFREAISKGVVITVGTRVVKDLSEQVHDEDTIHVMPLPSGGSNTLFKLSSRISESDIAQVIEWLRERSNGAIVLFIGVVREDGRDGAKVRYLMYEAADNEVVESFAQKILSEVLEKYEVSAAAVVHRVGEARVGEYTVIVGTAAKHRKEAFEACKELLEKVKHELPVWKKEVTEKGSYWVED